MVIGRYDAGRTIFSAFDDSWRWRYYTGEPIFDAYWVQQLRYLPRGRKLGQRKFTFSHDQDVYELGKQVSMQVRVMSADLLQQMNPPITVELVNDATGEVVKRLELNKQEGDAEVFSGSFTADKIGNFTARLPRIGGEEQSISYRVETPLMELVEPQVDTAALSRLATETPIPFAQAALKLSQIHSRGPHYSNRFKPAADECSAGDDSFCPLDHNRMGYEEVVWYAMMWEPNVEK